jgi:hypothetical protein
VLTDKERRDILAKVVQVQDLLRSSGLNSEIEVRACDSHGYSQLHLAVDNGFWRASTEVCNPGIGAERWEPEVDAFYNNNEWAASAVGC